VFDALEAQLETVDAELRRFARGDRRCRALQSIYGVGPILACHLLAEIGEASRFRRAEQITHLAGLDPVVVESGETRRRGKLAKQARRTFAGRLSKQQSMRTGRAPLTSRSTGRQARGAT